MRGVLSFAVLQSAGSEATHHPLTKNVNLQPQNFVVPSWSLSQEKRWLRYLKIENWLLAIASRLLVPKEAAWHRVGLAWPKGGPWACWS
jgi:hypothetical protein